MAASLVLRGAVDPDLFLDSNGEGIFLYAKFHHWHAETEKESGNKFMKNTATLIEKYPGRRAIHESVIASLAEAPSKFSAPNITRQSRAAARSAVLFSAPSLLQMPVVSPDHRSPAVLCGAGACATY